MRANIYDARYLDLLGQFVAERDSQAASDAIDIRASAFSEE